MAKSFLTELKKKKGVKEGKSLETNAMVYVAPQ
jgi:hypothetical protein